MTIMVPKSSIEDFSTPRSATFPEGTFVVVLEETRERSFPDFVGENVAAGKNTGYASGDGETLGLQFGGARDVTKPANTSNLKLFVDIVTRDGTTTIEDETIPEKSWQLDRSRTLLAMLAAAFGATEEVEFEGKTYEAIAEGFLEALRRGDYRNAEVVVTTYHRNWKKGEKSGTEVRVREFLQAV